MLEYAFEGIESDRKGRKHAQIIADDVYGTDLPLHSGFAVASIGGFGV